ncbi:protein kinase [Streptomyces sp. HNM0663]|uniref:non-specific serine/threonine protein kinase n=1 Tax=Streptomyces chengmaiensis TaxID=3040919 RepID=A0ABT6HL93_9ACTN|nr:serine/threonine-protein kinase [Streptomyces chengmaiensis]MDH2389504.1 protein kinase [Streptomyces chengmaiensis]
MSEAEQSREPQRAAGPVSGTEPRGDSQEPGKQPESAADKASDASTEAPITPGSGEGSGNRSAAAHAKSPHQSTGSAADTGPVKASAPKAGAPDPDAETEAGAESTTESEPGRRSGRTGGKKAETKAERKPEQEKPAQSESGQAEASPPEAAPAAGASDSARPETGRPATSDAGTQAGAKSDAPKSGTDSTGAGKADSGKPDSAKGGTSKAGAGKADSGKPDSVKGGTSKAGSGTAGSGKGESAKAGAGGGRSAASAPAAGRGAAGADGQLLAGRYRLGGVLGRGGMGTVWRAVDETLGRTVAVKELRFPNSIDEDEKRRLITRTLREAKAIARIRNNSAVTVYDVVDEDDRPWIVMELVEGKSLAEVIREDGTLTPRRAAEVGLAILDVLRSAHRQGILHRDVKPSNVLIAEDGRVVLTDFGIAQVEGDPSITSTGMLVGAPSYISPERARGHKPGPAADLWSLGGLLYASVDGAPPYDKGSAIATLTAVMTEPLDPPKNAGPLEEVIYGLLAKDPEQRLDDTGARKLLTAVVHAPEAPEPAVPEPESDATRVIAMPPPPPPAPPRGPAARPPAQTAAKDPAADRLRGALRSVRNAAAAAAAPEPKPQPQQPAGRPAPVRAPITDVVSRRTLVIVAVVVVLAVLSTVLLLTLGGGDEGGKDSQGDKNKTASAGAANGGGDGGAATEGQDPAKGGNAKDTDSGGSPGPDGAAAEGAGNGAGNATAGDAGDDPDGQQGDDGGKNGDKPGGESLPAGYATVSNTQFNFTVAMPEKFKQTGIAGRNSGAIFSESGGFPRLQIDFTSSPGDDAAWAWQQAVSGVRASSSGYKHLGIDKVAYNGYPTVADWQFERNQGGERVRVLNRGFKVDARHGYSIMISCKASEWQDEECTTLRETAFATFSPKD